MRALGKVNRLTGIAAQLESAYNLHCTALQGPTWQQAVQYVPEVPLKDGERYTITVKHDTYGLSFNLCSDTASTSLVPVASGSSHSSPPVPLYVSACLSLRQLSGLR